MTTPAIFRSVMLNDLKLIVRAPWLKWMVFLPLFVALLMLEFYRGIFEGISTFIEFDLMPFYEPMMGFVLMWITPNLVGGLMGFLYLDEKDNGTFSVIQVTPLSLNGFLACSLAIPTLITLPLVYFSYPIAGFNGVGTWDLVAVSIVAAPMTPAFALFMAVVAANKVQGIALFKVIGFVFLPPMIAYFVHSNWQYAFAIIPTYWPAKFYWVLLEEGHFDFFWFFGSLTVGIGSVVLLARLLERSMTRR